MKTRDEIMRRNLGGGYIIQAYSLMEPGKLIREFIFANRNEVVSFLHNPERFNDQIRRHTIRLVMPGINLSGVSIERARLIDGDLEQANFSACNLYDARFNGSNLKNANFHKAILEEGQFCKLNLHLAESGSERHFDSADLTGANFSASELVAVKLHFANCAHVNFRGATFREVKAAGTSFESADFRDAFFVVTNVEFANFHGAKISPEQLNQLSWQELAAHPGHASRAVKSRRIRPRMS